MSERRREWDPREWSQVDRAIGIGFLTLPYIAVNMTLARAVAADPSVAPFADQDFLGIFLVVHVGFAFVFGAHLAWGLYVRSREPQHRVYVLATIYLSAAFGTFFMYSSGLLTSPTILYLFGAIVGGTLLFPWRDVLGASLVAVVVLVVLAWTEQRGWIPYAPLIAGSPVQDGHLSTWWLTRIGPYTVLFLLMTIVLFAYMVQQWRSREERLERAYGDLAKAHDDLQRADVERRTLEKALETLHLGVTIATPGGEIVYANPAGASLHGYDRDELVGRSVDELATEEGSGRSPSSIDEALRCRKDGSTFPAHVVTDRVTSPEHEEDTLVSICEDVSERKQIEEALRTSEERYALVLEGTHDGYWDWDLRTNEIEFSARWNEMLGLEGDDVAEVPGDWFWRVHPEDQVHVSQAFEDHVSGRTDHLEVESRIAHRDGSYRWVLIRGIGVRDASSEVVRIVGSQADVTERSVHDRLTGLPNQMLFRDRVRQAIRRTLAEEDDAGYAVLITDVDRLKDVNESLGHGAGDQLLAQLGGRLAGCVDPGDTVARLGGDEFAILLEDVDSDEAAADRASRIQEVLDRPYWLGGQEVFASACMGIAFGRGTAHRPRELIRDAETALQRAKSSGQGAFEVFRHEMRQEAVERHRIETELRSAIDRGEVVPHYQPIVHLGTEGIAGFEALARWPHPERGWVSPATFIPVAEETGLIGALGIRILRESCRQLRAWHRSFPADPPLGVSVNLSARQFAHPTLVDDVRSVLEETGLEPRALKLEITETVVMDDAEASVRTLARLRELGPRLSIDDFGTGYSSLRYLQRFPVDTLKIDRTFVCRIQEGGEGLEVVRAIVRLAESLGMDVIAEGAETPEQVALLREVGCPFVQGHAYGQPASAEETEERLRGHRPDPGFLI